MLADNPDYLDRIKSGKRVEYIILTNLRKKGFKIEDPTAEEDKYDKIDGWWIGHKGGRHSLQLKFRETGDDILFELVKDVDKKIDGRDLKSKAELYLVANRMGVTRLFFTKPIKEKAKELLKFVQEDLIKNPAKNLWSGNGFQVRLQTDRGGNQRKIVAYFDPNMFEALATWQLNLHESTLKETIKSENFLLNINELYTNNREALRIAKLAFPEFNGKEIGVMEFSGPMRLDSYWNEGSRDYYSILNLSTNRSKTIPENGNIGNPKIFKISKLPPNFAVVRYHIGKYKSITIYVNPENITKMLPQQTDDLSWAEKVVLVATRSLKSSYGGISNYRLYSAKRETGITGQEWNEAKSNLIKKGMLNSAGAITINGKNAIGQTQLYTLRRSNQTGELEPA